MAASGAAAAASGIGINEIAYRRRGVAYRNNETWRNQRRRRRSVIDSSISDNGIWRKRRYRIIARVGVLFCDMTVPLSGSRRSRTLGISMRSTACCAQR